MVQQPLRPLEYATPPKRTKLWLFLLIGGIVAAVLLVAVVAFAAVGWLFFRSSPMPAKTVPIATVQTLKAASFRVTFQGDAIGSAPTAFVSALTGGGGPATWEIVQDGGETVLAQTSTDSTSDRFPLCIYRDGPAEKDVVVSTRFKAISGKVDQAGGLIVRYQDKDNYYVVRANALENNVRLYKVIGGERTQIAGADVKVTSGNWHSLTLDVKGSHFKVLYEDTPLFEADDSSIGSSGQVGFWTKADSVTEFDGLTISPGMTIP